jgi:hypothetical protein
MRRFQRSTVLCKGEAYVSMHALPAVMRAGRSLPSAGKELGEASAHVGMARNYIRTSKYVLHIMLLC